MDDPVGQPPPTLYITKQPIYRCDHCGHEGVAERLTVTPWRWWHYLIALLFPIGTLIVAANTDPIRRCANCHTTKLTRIRYEQLPKPPPLTDTNTIRNARHRKIAFATVLALIVLRIIASAASSNQPTTSATNQQTQDTSSQAPQDVVLKADQDEGYKAGYADGRARTGQVGDSYGPPATQERKAAYVRGYLAGYVVGCEEGGYDCSAVEKAINDALNPSTTSPSDTQ